MSYDCYRDRIYENQGRCFQDHPQCSTMDICHCRECYCGSQCQLSTKESTLSLDTTLGYHICPNIAINEQSVVIKISIVLTTTMFIVSLINSILSYLTFRMKKSHDVRCGIHHFVSSTISMIGFLVEFLLLLLIQMNLISNRKFLKYLMHIYSLFSSNINKTFLDL